MNILGNKIRNLFINKAHGITQSIDLLMENEMDS
jgi:hypothetical protein